MPKRHGHSDHHGGSGKSRQTQEDYEIFDYDLYEEQEETGASSSTYPDPGAYSMASGEAYSQDDPGQDHPFVVGPDPELHDIQAYYDNLSTQPSTVDPSSLFSQPGPSSTPYDPVDPYQQDSDYAQPSSSISAERPHKCPKEDCDRSYRIESQLTKHLKTHDKPLKCKADKGCNVRQAQQRDMDRHYRTAHKKYAEKQGILEKPSKCRLCGETFTRPDNLHKHMKKKHS
ncbi:hypothetical protein QQX98_010074 [Neonectria punicea]|uniref:C2H2-type domain-containing protein n=1 Tax=Neonectria punicea TaxID=979145 RepID=A0ABR1GQD0_9HYPO